MSPFDLVGERGDPLDGAADAGTPRPIKIYLDSGDSGPSKDDVVETAELAAAYRALGIPRGRTSSTSSRPARSTTSGIGPGGCLRR